MVQYIIFQQRQFENRIPQRVAKEAEMQVGDLVKFRGSVGVVTCIDPEEIGDTQEVEVSWSEGDVGNMSCGLLEVLWSVESLAVG